MKSSRLFILALALGCGGVAAAETGLYVGRIPVSDQSAAQRERAMPLALQQVVGKLTGLRELADVPAAETALQQARAKAISFHYEKSRQLQPDGSDSEQLELVTQFSPQAVDALLQELQLPRWQQERHPLAVWLLIDDGASRSIMPVQFEYARMRMAAVAEARGMPLVFPQPGEDGTFPVDIQLLWGGYTEQLAEQGATHVLLLAARREPADWNVRLNLDYAGHASTWRQKAAQVEDALVEGMNRAIDEIVALNSIAASGLSRWEHEIEVSGLAGAADYARCLAYLQGLSLVEHVAVLGAAPGKLRLRLTLNALPEYLETAFGSGGMLSAGDAPNFYALTPEPQHE